jgi:hypothetical protein
VLLAKQNMLITEFNLTPLFEPQLWHAYLGSDKPDMMGQIHDVRSSLSLFVRCTPAVVKILARAGDEALSKDHKEGNDGKAVTTILIKDKDVPELSVRHLSSILNDIETLYHTIAKIYGIDGGELVIGSMDSGSEKSFDVIGVASGISKLSSFLLECWNRVRFHSAEKAERNIKTASEGLDLMAKIQQNLEKRSIDETEAARLKKVVLKCVNNLFNNGVYTPEMELIVVVKPSQLPVERRKMIPYIRNTDDPDLYSTSNQGPSAVGDLSGAAVKRRPSATKKVGARKQPRKNTGSLRS